MFFYTSYTCFVCFLKSALSSMLGSVGVRFIRSAIENEHGDIVLPHGQDNCQPPHPRTLDITMTVSGDHDYTPMGSSHTHVPPTALPTLMEP
jgi:hypothetical protein